MAAENGEMLKINDPDKLSQSIRIREILGRRKDTLQVRDEARRQMVVGNINESDALDLYRSQIESLLMDVYSKLRGDENVIGQKYLEEVHVTTIQVQPPSTMPTTKNDPRLGPGASPVAPHEEEIHGLNHLFDYPNGFGVTFQTRIMEPECGVQRETVNHQLGWGDLDQFMLRISEFIDDVGIDADFDSEKSDIIRDFDQSGEEPQGYYNKVEYNGNPDL